MAGGGGGDQKTLLCLYRALVRSKLDNGCIVYGAASNNILKKLDPIHHQGLRIALGAFRTSPVTSLYAKSKRNVFKKQKRENIHELCIKTKNWSYGCVFEPPNLNFFEKSNLTQPLGLRILPLFEDYKTDLDVVNDTTVTKKRFMFA